MSILKRLGSGYLSCWSMNSEEIGSEADLYLNVLTTEVDITATLCDIRTAVLLVVMRFLDLVLMS